MLRQTKPATRPVGEFSRVCRIPGCQNVTYNRGGTCTSCIDREELPPPPPVNRRWLDWNEQVKKALGPAPGVEIPRVVELGRGISIAPGTGGGARGE